MALLSQRLCRAMASAPRVPTAAAIVRPAVARVRNVWVVAPRVQTAPIARFSTVTLNRTFSAAVEEASGTPSPIEVAADAAAAAKEEHGVASVPALTAYTKLAGVLRSQKLIGDARDVLANAVEAAAAAAEAASATPELRAAFGHAWHELGVVESRLSNIEAAEAAFNTALKFLSDDPDAPNTVAAATVLLSMGRHRLRKGPTHPAQPKAAIEAYDAAVSAFERARASPLQIAKALGDKAAAYMAASQPQDALTTIQLAVKALNNMQTSDNPEPLRVKAMLLETMGDLYAYKPSIHDATIAWSEAADLFKLAYRAQDLAVPRCLKKLGRAHLVWLQQPTRALAFLQEAATAIEAAGLETGSDNNKSIQLAHAEVLALLGEAQLVSGQAPTAVATFQQLLPVVQKLYGDQSVQANRALLQLAGAYMCVDDFTSAASTIQMVLPHLRERLGPSSGILYDTLMDLGRCYKATQHTAQAADAFREAATVAKGAFPKDATFAEEAEMELRAVTKK